MKDALAALSYFLPNSVCSFRVTIRNSDLQELAKDTVLNPNIQTIGTFTWWSLDFYTFFLNFKSTAQRAYLQ